MSRAVFSFCSPPFCESSYGDTIVRESWRNRVKPVCQSTVLDGSIFKLQQVTDLEPCLSITVICHKEQAYQKNNLAISKKIFFFFAKASTAQIPNFTWLCCDSSGENILSTVDAKCLRCLRALCSLNFPTKTSLAQSLEIPTPKELLVFTCGTGCSVQCRMKTLELFIYFHFIFLKCWLMWLSEV